MSLLYRMGTGNGSGGDLKPFIINFTCDSGFIGNTVTMEFQGTPHAGETVDNVSGTVVLDSTDGKGKLTLYPMHDGLWKYYATSDVSGYQEGTITLEKWGNYPVELKDIPNGATVTPTDNVQTWLHCANVWDKSYTTISEVVADTTTLNTLISDNNASDYLARSTTWASDICNNESAMTYIGLNDYCANTLLNDSTWVTAICSVDETLFTKVLNIYVPRMESNTMPSGEVSCSSEQSDRPAWKAFDKDTLSRGWIAEENTNAWIAYDFGKEVKVNAMDIMPWANSAANGSRVKDFILQGYDGNEWKDIYNDTFPNDGSENKLYSFINNKAYSKYRLYVENNYSTSGGNVVLIELQFYGRVSS